MSVSEGQRSRRGSARWFWLRVCCEVMIMTLAGLHHPKAQLRPEDPLPSHSYGCLLKASVLVAEPLHAKACVSSQDGS
jgi:hypothetical protein